MKRIRNAARSVMVALPVVLVLAAWPRPGATAERIVEIDSLRGLPVDAAQRDDFLEGFHAAFDEHALAIESRVGEAWQRRGSFVNRFQLARDRSVRPRWKLQVFVELPPMYGTRSTPGHMEQSGSSSWWVPGTPARADRKRRAARGLVVSVRTQSPNEEPGGSTFERTSIAFPALDQKPAESSGSADTVLSRRAFEIPWTEAGRAVGRLALEALHRRSRDLGEDQRFDLGAAVRVEGRP